MLLMRKLLTGAHRRRRDLVLDYDLLEGPLK